MPEKDFYSPTDPDALRRENELLALEVRFLKAQLAEAGRRPPDLQNKLKEAEKTINRLKKRPAMAPRHRVQLENAERDLIALLTRLSKSPLGRVLRLKKGYRNLEQRYLKAR